MHYTIAFLEEAHSGFFVEYGIHGDKRYISINDKKTGTCWTQEFKDKDEAAKVFLALTNAVLCGMYNFEDRTKILMGIDVK